MGRSRKVMFELALGTRDVRGVQTSAGGHVPDQGGDPPLRGGEFRTYGPENLQFFTVAC